MNVSRTEKSRFWIAYFLKDLPVGLTFSSGVLHLTIVPWFVSDKPDDLVTDSFSNYFSKAKPFEVRLGERAKFGPKKSAPITLVEPSGELAKLHEAALEWLGRIDAKWAVKNPYVGDEFRPHIRHRRGTQLEQELITIDSLTLVRAQRREDNVRQVAAKVELL